jgi:N-carbamoyl-L-amino-acid hydrolase
MLNRRQFLSVAAGAAAAAGAVAPRSAAGRQSVPAVQAARLRRRLEQLSTFGRPAGGTFADGVSRVAYSDADIAGRAWLMDEMRGIGLVPRIDPAGNIFALRDGTDPQRRPILFGSHIDTVPNGGNFDGPLGSVAALEVMHACEAAGVPTRHPLEMVVWAHEEGFAFTRGLAGSRIVAGDLAPGDMDQAWNGLTRAEAIRRIGGVPDRIEEAVRQRDAHHCYLELHIEQGGTLEAAGVQIGIVTGIVASHRYEVLVHGVANHSGTTPMDQRRDALVAASQIVLAVRAVGTSRPGRQVATVGRLDVVPNSPNAVPGQVTLIIDLRDLSADLLELMADEIRERAAGIAQESGTTVEMRRVTEYAAAEATPAVQQVIADAADDAGLTAVRMPSGAGHDAGMMARLGPMGMILVPSVDGVSHSPRELTSWEDCGRGAEVLLGAVLRADARDSMT